MRRRNRFAGLLLAFLLLGGGRAGETQNTFGESGGQPRTDLLGKPAPDFTLTDPDGGSVSLADLREGNRVVIVQMWASWCMPCYIESLINTQMLRRFGADDLSIVGLHANDPSVAMIPEVRARIGMAYPVAVATDAVWSAYGNTPVLPASVVLGRDGRVRHVGTGVQWVDQVEPMLETLIGESVDQARAATVTATDFDVQRETAQAGPAAAASTPAEPS